LREPIQARAKRANQSWRHSNGYAKLNKGDVRMGATKPRGTAGIGSVQPRGAMGMK